MVNTQGFEGGEIKVEEGMLQIRGSRRAGKCVWRGGRGCRVGAGCR